MKEGHWALVVDLVFGRHCLWCGNLIRSSQSSIGRLKIFEAFYIVQIHTVYGEFSLDLLIIKGRPIYFVRVLV